MQGDLRHLIVGREEMAMGEKRLTSVILRHLSASDSCRRALLHRDSSGFSALDEVSSARLVASVSLVAPCDPALHGPMQRFALHHMMSCVVGGAAHIT